MLHFEILTNLPTYDRQTDRSLYNRFWRFHQEPPHLNTQKSTVWTQKEFPTPLQTISKADTPSKFKNRRA